MKPIEYNQQVDERAQKILSTCHHDGRDQSLWSAHALMPHNPDPKVIVEIILKSLWRGSDTKADKLLGGPFEILPAMLFLCRWENQLPNEAIVLLKDFMTLAHLERGNTENHWLMAYSGILLATERWPNDEYRWSGLPSNAIAAEAKRWINGIINRTATQGHHEYDSTGYHIEHMTAYIGLYEHTQDEELRSNVEKMFTLLVADMALEFFHGAWAGGHSREGYRQNTWSQLGGILPLQYMYFGGLAFDRINHVHNFAIPAVIADYRPSPLFAEIAWDRKTAHVVKKTKAPRTIYRNAKTDAKPVRKYTYMSNNFALGSTQTGLPGEQAAPIDLVSWDLTWNAPNHQGIIVCNHPYNSPDRFSSFLNGFPQSIGRSISSDKPYLQWPDRLFGASPYEEMLQHEGCIIILYDIPEKDTHPFVNLFLPNKYSWLQENGWLFANIDSFFISLFPLGKYEWTTIREANNANILVREGDLIDGWLLRLKTHRPGLILEAIEAKNVESFESFVEKRSKVKPNLKNWTNKKQVAFRTTTGKTLDLTHGGRHLIDGTPVDYNYDLYEGPGISAPLNTGRMKFENEYYSIKLDFGVDLNEPLMPMRVIG